MRGKLIAAGILLLTFAFGGIVFYVIVSERMPSAKSVRVSVDVGEVQLNNGKQSRTLKPGEQITVTSAMEFGKTQKTDMSSGVIASASTISSTSTLGASTLASATADIQNASRVEYWVTGYSRKKEGNQPLPGTVITAFLQVGKEIGNLLATTQTNSEGYYTIAFREPGRYYLKAVPVDESLTEAETYIKFDEKETTANENFLHLQAGLSIRGIVLDSETNQPIEGAEVNLAPYPLNMARMDDYRPKAKSGADGRFVITRIPPNTYNIEAQAKGYVYYKPIPWEKPDPLGNLTINENTQAKEYEVKLKPGGSVIARVFDQDKKRLAKIYVTLITSENYKFIPSFSGWTDENGEWRSDTIPKGTAILVAKGDIRKEAKNWDLYGLTFSEKFEPGTVENPKVVKITMNTPSAISGTVTFKNGSPAEGYILFAFLQDNQKWFGKVDDSIYFDSGSDKNGNYKFKGLGAGSYDVYVRKKSQSGGYSSRDNINGKVVTLKSGETKTGVDFVINETNANESVKGNVIDQSGKPLVGIHVIVMIRPGAQGEDKTGTVSSAETDEQGVFEVKGLVKAPEFTLSVLADKYKKFMKQFPMDGKFLTITLEGGGVLSGIAIDKVSKQPVPNVFLTLNSFSDMNYHPTTTTTAADGKFQFETQSPGTYQITTQAKEYPRIESALITVQSGQDAGDIVLEMDKGLTYIGRLIDPQGNPAAGVSVGLLSSRVKEYRSLISSINPVSLPNSVSSDGEGIFKIQLNPNQDDSLVIRSRQWAPQVIPVSAKDVRPEPIPIPLTNGGVVEGTVLDLEDKPAADIEITVVDEPDWLFPAVAHTNEKGEYRIERIPGSVVTVKKIGTQGAAATEYQQTTVREGETVRVDFGGGSGATIHGTVLKGNQPTAGTIIVVENIGSGRYRKSAVSQSDGNFQIKGIPDGEYRILATTDAGDNNFSAYYADWVQRIQVTPEQREFSITINILTAEVTGVVIDAQDGSPIPMVSIQSNYDAAGDPDLASRLPVPTKTDSEGKFKLVLRDPGICKMIAFKTGYLNQPFDIVFNPPNPGVTVEPINVDVKMTKTDCFAEINLQWNRQPFAADQIYFILPTTGKQMLSYESDPQQPGYYRVSGFSPGTVQISIMAEKSGMFVAFPDPFSVQAGQTVQVFADMVETLHYRLDLKTSDGKTPPADVKAYRFEIPEFPQFSLLEMGSLGNPSNWSFSVPCPKGRVHLRLFVQGYKPVECIPADLAKPYSLPIYMNLPLLLEKE